MLAYAEKTYRTKPDCPFPRDYVSVVLRHEDTRKWYAIIMEVKRERLGLSGDGYVFVINLKTGDPVFHDVIIHEKGYMPAYHMNKMSWITILLDGTVPLPEICAAIDMSYEATASAKKKQKIRRPKEWIIPANPKYYDIVRAFDDADEIDWKQGSGIRKGDTVFMYAAAPVSAIIYECLVTETDIPFSYQDENLTIKSLMRVRLVKRFQPDRFTFETLKKDYDIYSVRGPRGVPQGLLEALKRE